jgi:hypothetical protein
MGSPVSIWIWVVLGIAEIGFWSGLLFPHRKYETLEHLVRSGDEWKKEQQLDSNIYWITFGARDREDVSACTLYRAAALTKEHGYERFVILDSTEMFSGILAMRVYVGSKTIRMTLDSSASSYRASDVMKMISLLVVQPLRDSLR